MVTVKDLAYNMHETVSKRLEDEFPALSADIRDFIAKTASDAFYAGWMSCNDVVVNILNTFTREKK